VLETLRDPTYSVLGGGPDPLTAREGGLLDFLVVFVFTYLGNPPNGGPKLCQCILLLCCYVIILLSIAVRVRFES